jgi:Dolichyl-phosphate-mannose-protein mannosyltransferase
MKPTEATQRLEAAGSGRAGKLDPADPAGDTPTRPAAGPGGAADVRLRPAETLWLAGAGTILAFLWASLVTAHLGVLSVGSVTALALAMVAAWLVPVAVAARRRGWRPRLSGWRPRAAGSLAEVAAMAAAAALLAALYLPGFPYGVVDKDPGVYVQHGLAIAERGGIGIHDDALARLPGLTLAEPPAGVWPGVRFPGFWVSDAAAAEVVPQFYHLYPATLGFLGRLSGQTAMLWLNPLLAAVSALGLYLIGRRLAGVAAGVVAAAVLGVNMMQVWLAKYPTTEISTQLLLVLAVLSLVAAIQTGRPALGVVAGAALGVAWLDRADALLAVLFALGVLAAAAALGRWGRLHTAVAAGLALTVPHALYQAFGPARPYTEIAGHLTPARLALAVGGLAVAALAGGWLWRSRLGRRAERAAGRLAGDPRRVVAVKALLPAGLAVLAAVAWFRPQLLGVDYFLYDARVIRSYDEDALRRLAWFLTVPGLLAAVAGFAVVALGRWRAAAWVAVGPALALLALYVEHAEIAPRLLWWTRRFVPFGLPVLALLIGIACAAALAWRGRGALAVRAAGLALAVLVVAAGLVQVRPLARHREFDGSFAASARIAAAAGGRQGVFVWDREARAATLFAVPLWLQRGQLSLLLPEGAGPDDLAELRRAFPGQPLLVVTDRDGPPPGLRGAGLTRTDRFRVRMPFWEQSVTRRPDHDVGIRVDVEVWSAR